MYVYEHVREVADPQMWQELSKLASPVLACVTASTPPSLSQSMAVQSLLKAGWGAGEKNS